LRIAAENAALKNEIELLRQSATTNTGTSNKKSGDEAKDADLPEQLEMYRGGDAARLWLTTTRANLPKHLKHTLLKTVELARIDPAWDDALPGLTDEQKTSYVEQDAKLYGLVLACLQTTVNHKDTSDKQKADAREMFNKVDTEMRTRDSESGISSIAYIQRLALGESTSEHTTAMGRIMSLSTTGGTSKDAHALLTTFKDLHAKLSGQIQPLWAITALKRALQSSSQKARDLSDPIVAVFDANADSNEKLNDLGLANLVQSLDRKFEQAVRDDNDKRTGGYD
jgi:hypothetical protein